MKSYWVKTPWWLKKILGGDGIWNIPCEKEPVVYITFDDGPHPVATMFALEQLEKYEAHATFFCVGNNVQKYPDVYDGILRHGHKTGNHTWNHLNGWKTKDEVYLENIEKSALLIKSNLFRPPYGRIKNSQRKKLMQQHPGWKMIMWDILCGDFDNTITPQDCLVNVLSNIRPGSIVLFHDSEKAWERMRYALPEVLAFCKNKNWKMEVIPY